MIASFWTVIIFVLFNWSPNGLCLNSTAGNEGSSACRAVFQLNPWIKNTFQKKIIVIKCWPIQFRTLNGARERLRLKMRNFDKPNFIIFHLKSYRLEFHCVAANQEARNNLYNTFTRRFKKYSLKHIVCFKNSTVFTRNVILGLSSFNARPLRRLGDLKTKQWRDFFRDTASSFITRKKTEKRINAQEMFNKKHPRHKRNSSGNERNATAFTKFFLNTNTTAYPVTPSLVTTVHSVSVTSGNITWSSRSSTDLCPRSVVVNHSTIFVTPAVMEVGSTRRLVATSKLTLVTQFSATVNSTVAPTMALNATTTSVLTHINSSSINATYIYKNHLVSILQTKHSYVFITTLSCATVSPSFTTLRSSQTRNITPTASTTTYKDDKKDRLYIGLISAGGAVFSIIILIGLFYFIRRYRRIKALRRKTKHLSYFNRYECSSPWDEADRFGSKLSVFTLKNSKFDIDWEPSQDTKQ